LTWSAAVLAIEVNVLKREMSRYLRLSLHSILVLAVFGGIFYTGTRADAAQTVVLKYSFLQDKVSVAELSTFAKTGELSPSLQFYLKMAGREPDQLRRILTQEVKVNPNVLSQVLNSSLGEAMLDRATQVIHTPSDRANRESLRGALVSSAIPDGKITLIETLENYPTSEVYIEGDRLVEFAQNIGTFLGRIPNLPNLPKIKL
jgi:hypothetical protein